MQFHRKEERKKSGKKKWKNIKQPTGTTIHRTRNGKKKFGSKPKQWKQKEYHYLYARLAAA